MYYWDSFFMVQGMMDGETNPTSAFMSGKLKVDGDMGMAMKLAAALA
jgi:putative sterol carrier protein